MNKNILMVFLLLAGFLFNHAWVPGFFHDGYLYAAFGKNAAELGHWLIPHASEATYSRFFHHLPFVFMLEGLFFKLFGASYLTARIFGAAFTFLTLLVLYRSISKENKTWAYFTSIVFVLLPPLLKKSRFPNLDLPLMLFTLLAGVTYLKAYSSNKLKDWLVVGVFFGLCTLTKGPMAIFVPLSILFHLALEKKLVKLLDIKAWAGLLLGLLIFCIWPILLYSTGNADIFQNYIHFTFLDTMRDSRGTGEPFYTYFFFLLKQTSIWFIFLMATIYYIVKRKYQSVQLNYFLALFLAVIVPLSFFKFKYSHYLIPLYPALAALAGYGLYQTCEKFKDKFSHIFNKLVVITLLVFLIFPVTTKVKRDPEIFKIREAVKLMGKLPKNWGVVDGVYPYWSLHNLNSFEDHTNTYNLNGKWWENLKGHDYGILIDAARFNSIKKQIDGRFKPLFHFKKRNMVFLIEKTLLKKL